MTKIVLTARRVRKRTIIPVTSRKSHVASYKLHVAI
jgi:hypothetical protein